MVYLNIYMSFIVEELLPLSFHFALIFVIIFHVFSFGVPFVSFFFFLVFSMFESFGIKIHMFCTCIDFNISLNLGLPLKSDLHTWKIEKSHISLFDWSISILIFPNSISCVHAKFVKWKTRISKPVKSKR